MKHTSFYILDDNEWIKIKISIARSGMKTGKFLWEAAKTFSKKRRVKEAGTITEFFGDMEKPDPDDVFSLDCWDKYMSDEKSFKKAKTFHRKLDDLIYTRGKELG